MAADHTRSLASRVAPFPVDGYNALTFPPAICGVCCPNVEPGPYSHRAGWAAGAHPAGARSYECPAVGSAGADRPAHGETSTGVEQPMADLGRIAQDHGAMLVVDAVATLGGTPVLPDAWGSAVCYSASQKCISAPPGLSEITVSDSAMAYIRERKVP